jgi:hypothetical protein
VPQCGTLKIDIKKMEYTANMDDLQSNPQLKLHPENNSGKLESKEWKEIRQNRLINSLNRINFHEGDIFLNFRHIKYNTLLSVPAKPQPFKDNVFECKWSAPHDVTYKINHYRFENFYFTDGLKQILVEAQLISITENGVSFCLPEKAVEVNSRIVKRYDCDGISLKLMQNGIFFDGGLATFSPASFSVNIPKETPFDGLEIKQEDPVDVIIDKDGSTFYTGICEILRISDTTDGNTLILKPVINQIQRFKPKKFRSIRQELIPHPNIIFLHPFTGRKVNLRVKNISGAGLSVEESTEKALLLPGMIIPEMIIEFMPGADIKCKSQVVYRTPVDDKNVKSGLAFVDMAVLDQIRLSSFLHQAFNENAYVCSKINIDDLWDFFFETGFVYPQKYLYMQNNRKKFDDIYKRLYEQDLDIAINFIYQDKGSIYGHMSMFRFYDKTWIINHHAANSSKRSRAGLVVLDQIGRYINEFHRLPSTRMEYVACYFRPDNKFPNLVFGGAAKNSSNGCSVNEFAYLHLNKNNIGSLCIDLPENWILSQASYNDLSELIYYYELKYGGLALKALDLEPSKINCDKQINEDFNAYGLKRERYIFALRNKTNLVAVFMVCVTELGMNLSDLTNCIHAFVLEPEKLSSEILYSTFSMLSDYYEHETISALIFPKRYTEIHSIPVDKTYNFWVLDIEKSSDEYFTHVNKLTKRVSKVICNI